MSPTIMVDYVVLIHMIWVYMCLLKVKKRVKALRMGFSVTNDCVFIVKIIPVFLTQIFCLTISSWILRGEIGIWTSTKDVVTVQTGDMRESSIDLPMFSRMKFVTSLILAPCYPHFISLCSNFCRLPAPQEVKIDSTTVMPADLYWTMLRAGDRAKPLGRTRDPTVNKDEQQMA